MQNCSYLIVFLICLLCGFTELFNFRFLFPYKNVLRYICVYQKCNALKLLGLSIPLPFRMKPTKVSLNCTYLSMCIPSPPGYYCPEGLLEPCPARIFNNITGLSTIDQCTNCTTCQYCQVHTGLLFYVFVLQMQ